jgi:hypothetical protein
MAMGFSLLKWPFVAVALAILALTATILFARAGCYDPRQQLSGQTVARFTADPRQLLSKYPHGGTQMIAVVRDLVASDPATLPLVLDLTAEGNIEQINSIGAGLGQAALVCSQADQAFAGEIRQMIAAVNNAPLALAFAEVIGDQPRPSRPNVLGGAEDGGALGSTNNAAANTPASTLVPGGTDGVIRAQGNIVNGPSSLAAAGFTGAIGVGVVALNAPTAGPFGQRATGSIGTAGSGNGGIASSVATQGTFGPPTSDNAASASFITLGASGVGQPTNLLPGSVSPSQ